MNCKPKFTQEEVPDDYTDTTADLKKFFVFLYMNIVSEITASIIDRSEFKIGYRCLNKLCTILKAHKDKNHITSNNNVIYRV